MISTLQNLQLISVSRIPEQCDVTGDDSAEGEEPAGADGGGGEPPTAAHAALHAALLGGAAAHRVCRCGV